MTSVTEAHTQEVQLAKLSFAPVELTILMPCLNERETIATCIDKAVSFLKRAKVAGEVLIADNGSTDGSIDIAKAAGARVVSVSAKGYGAALLGGIESARGRYVIMGDADDSYNFADLDLFLEKLRDGYDVVMGNRFRGGIEKDAMPFLHRYLGNPVLSSLGRLFFSIPVGDFHCGLRGFRKDSIDSLQLQTTGMEFASEMVVKSGLLQLRIAEVPTTLKPDGRSRAPHLKTWRDGWRHLKFLLIYSPKWLFFIPGIAITSVALLCAAALMFGPVRVLPGIVLDLNSFLAACLLSVMGVQIITLGAIARYYATISGILPRGRRSDFIVNFCQTDQLVLVAFGIAVLGGILLGWSLFRWAGVDFGNLSDPLVPRIVAAGLSLLAISIQLAFSAFLFGILNVPIKDKK